MAQAKTAGPATYSLEDLGLSKSQVTDMYRDMLMARAVSERLWVLGRQGKVYFLVSCEGHEAAQIGSAHAMRRGVDVYYPYYRDLGVAIAAGSAPIDLILHALGKRADPYSGGRQLPGHYSRKDLNIVSGSSCVATQILHAVGSAYASKYRHEDTVTIVYFGDGATSKGDFHEAMNFAGIHRLPVIFFCENNRLAVSVPLDKQMASESIAVKADGYGSSGITVDGNDVLKVYEATREAAQRAREGLGPTLIEAKTYRFTSHSSNDDQSRYRTEEELEQERAFDPIPRFQSFLLDSSLITAKEDKKLRSEVQHAVDVAVTEAESSEDPTPEDALDHIYANG